MEIVIKILQGVVGISILKCMANSIQQANTMAWWKCHYDLRRISSLWSSVLVLLCDWHLKSCIGNYAACSYLVSRSETGCGIRVWHSCWQDQSLCTSESMIH